MTTTPATHATPDQAHAPGTVLVVGATRWLGAMITREIAASEVLREGLRLLEREQGQEAAKVAVLRQAAEQGWSDLALGRFDDVDDESLKDFIGQLSVRATKTQSAG